MTKKFMFACIGIAILVVGYAVGASQSHAQFGAIEVAHVQQIGTEGTLVVTVSGDFYARRGFPNVPLSGAGWGESRQWQFLGNCFTGTVNSQGSTIGDVKGLFR